MKHLTDTDIKNMLGDEFIPDNNDVRRTVRGELHLARRIPKTTHVPQHLVLDLHHNTEDQAWDKIMRVATSGARTATIITGASGILKIKFQQWAHDSILAPYIVSVTPINNGSFAVKFKKKLKSDF